MTTMMKAIGFSESKTIDEENSLYEFEMAMPEIGEFDLLVKVAAISVNPADAKIRVRSAVNKTLESPRVLGFDAVGEVVSVGSKVTSFTDGDRVYYAGDVTRPGTNAQYHAVDSRIVARAPKGLTDAEAAVVPLTALTGWEALFDRLRVDPSERKTLLIIGGAGGVGSITTQIAKQLTNLTVIATASRPETEAWVKEMGADYVANHRNLVESVHDLGFETVDYIFNVADTVGHWDAMAELIAPQGMIGSIVEFDSGIDLSKLQGKSVGFVWELMFTRSIYKTQDMYKQGDILKQVANLIDSGRIQSTLTKEINGFNAESLKQGHRLMESGAMIGKLAINFD
ncbi:zinc-binding alcohol dehydrogenase family protein [Vibrio mediterranei]|uniref:Zinc-type alcohol dehydrogenase-like protein n=2 Tax=Vibrio mediterranei TaxID=689 RepID=A0ABX5D5R6_9VIBR|nr:zinc-binding alcohol dehydrogenase family protein [Vibrio mediterranei]MCG9659792.1 zinc-binding alcohol dehydrogenase family protein [Vibrio mediterranei]MCG9661748.1 zinc-binding alcohol dehydrogenase family protein [Vibrio mediterranei]PCD88293.1 NADPH:quinone reductase [Vibrio mediterranei]PRQ64942.1 NADPH:quinone reductase [Vibrio mediterranei]PTC02863.1 zinc-binding alcohol dehydrogenase family protein [Vibrio mediterranei]